MIDPFARPPENEREELEAVLVAHQRHKGGCLCGWAKLGHSHPLHQADQILARWRLVPMEEQQSYEARQAMLCGCGGMDWDGHIGGCPHAQPDLSPTETP